MIAEGEEEQGDPRRDGASTAPPLSRGIDAPSRPAPTSPMLRMTSRTSRGMTPTAAMPVPAVKPRPSDLARA